MEERKIGTLIVKNGTAVQIMIEIEVTKNGQPIKHLSELNILSSDLGASIPLLAGIYVVTALFRDKNGNVEKAQKEITIKDGEPIPCEFNQVPQEAEVYVSQNLV